MPMENGEKTILAIDGGGIRGLVPALILKDLEERLAARGKRERLFRYFDLLVGTSTGGIIAAGLAAPKRYSPRVEDAMTAAELAELYQKDGPKIFHADRFRGFREAIKRREFKPLSQEKYDAGPLEQVLARHFSGETMNRAHTNVMITAYDLKMRRTVWMSGGPDFNDRPGNTGDVLFRDAARATSAAPTYFEPASVAYPGSDGPHPLVDGGVFANQPALSGFAEAMGLGWPANEIRVLSLGTGYQTRSYHLEDVKDWGPVNWIHPGKGAPIISILMHGQADATNWQMRQILGDKFTRLDAPLTEGKGNDDMDDASGKNLDRLSKFAAEIIADHSKELDAWADGLGK